MTSHTISIVTSFYKPPYAISHPMLCHTIPCHIPWHCTLYHVMLSHARLHCTISHYPAMPCHTTISYSPKPYYSMPYDPMSCNTIPCHTISCQPQLTNTALCPCQVMLWHTISCLVIQHNFIPHQLVACHTIPPHHAVYESVQHYCIV